MKIDRQHKYFKISLWSFLTAGALIVLYLVLTNISSFGSGISKAADVLMPFLYGYVIAYVLNYPYSWLLKKVRRIKLKKPISEFAAKVISVTITFVLFLVVLAAFFYIVVPQIVNAIMGLTSILPVYAEILREEAEQFFATYLHKFNMSGEEINKILSAVSNQLFENFNLTRIMKNFADIIIKMSVGIKNLLMGIIISIYLLMDKERFINTGKKLLYCVFSKENTHKILDVLRFTDKTFGGFMIAKVVDSVIIGIICYIGMLLLKLEYAVLISVIVGVTNIIPFFGPFIGAIPSALLLLLVSPWQCLIFIIFIIVLQQFDGNILGPKLLGDSTGIRAIYVVFAVLVGGGLFGFVGMFVGVPFFAVLYALTSRFVNNKLKARDIDIE